MTQTIGIFISSISSLAGIIGLINTTDDRNINVFEVIIWLMVLLSSLFFLFISIYSLQSYNQSEKTNKLIKQNNEMLEQILLSLNPDNEYHKRKAQKEADLAKPKEEPILPKDGIPTYQTFLMKMKNSSHIDESDSDT